MMNASCVFSGEVEGETVDKSSGTADLINVSVMASGEGNAVTADKLSSPPEYPRVTRLRHRRLMAYLWCQGFRDSYNELMNKTRAHMNLLHLYGLIEVGRWAEAIEYVDRFLPPATCPKSFFADVFRCFLVMLHRFADAAAGKEDKLLPKHYLELNHGKAVSHADLRLSSICMSVIALDGVRANINWQRVWRQASSLVYTLARCVPELRGCVALPTAGIKPHHVLPIASGLRSQRRYVKLKNTGSKKRKAIISALKRQCRISSRIGSVEEAKELLADLLDASVRSGVQMLSSDLSHPLENEGAQFFQPMSGTLTEAKTSGPLTEAKTSGPLTNAGAQFRQLIPGTLTEAKTSGPSTNAGTSKHEEEAGYHTITARQDSDGRKNSRDELATAEQDRALKRQRSNGAPGEATLVMPGYCAVEVLGAKPSGGETAAP